MDVDHEACVVVAPPDGFAVVRGRLIDLTCEDVASGDLCAVVPVGSRKIILQRVECIGHRIVMTAIGIAVLLGTVVDC